MDRKRLGQWFDRIENSLSGLAVCLLVAITLSVCLEVVLRYGFNRPLVWVVEITEYALVYITFLGAAWVLREDGHVRIDIVLSALPSRWQHRLQVLGSVFGLGVSAVLTVFGLSVTWRYYTRGFYKATLLEFPTWIVLLIIPIGSFLLCVRFVRKMADHWRAMQ